MEIIDFVAQYWQIIRASPAPFIAFTAAVFAAGFGAGKAFYSSATESAKERAAVANERLEAARDDLARLEARNAEDGRELAFIKVELAALKKTVDEQPRIYSGVGPPNIKGSRDGDIYLQTSESDPLTDDHAQAQPTHAKLENVVSMSEAGNSPSSASFFLRPPQTSMRDAMRVATAANKPVFLVIYDPAHPSQSKLAYSLGYFLEYMTTRKLIDEHFVAALVPNTDGEANRLVPEDDPLERCRWIVLSPSGRVLQNEGMYANPDEGLKRTRAAIALADDA